MHSSDAVGKAGKRFLCFIGCVSSSVDFAYECLPLRMVTRALLVIQVVNYNYSCKPTIFTYVYL